MPPPLKTNRGLGIGLFITGIIFVGGNLLTREWADTWFPKLLMAGVIILFLGFAMMLFPPYDANMDDRSNYFKEVFKRTPKIRLVIWLAFLIASIFVMFWLLDQLNFSLG